MELGSAATDAKEEEEGVGDGVLLFPSLLSSLDSLKQRETPFKLVLQREDVAQDRRRRNAAA